MESLLSRVGQRPAPCRRHRFYVAAVTKFTEWFDGGSWVATSDYRGLI
jgi:hypothetical protein